MSKIFNKVKGDLGEEKAVKFLKRHRYKILEKKFNTRIGEIDIIASKKNIIHFVEVKYRKNTDYGYPREAVNYYKQKRIRRTAEYYCMLKKIRDVELSFDIIEIIDKKLNFIENAF